MKIRGLLSIEAVIALLVLLALISSMPIRQSFSGGDLPLAQKMGDLLIVWAQTHPSREEMENDFSLFFGDAPHKIELVAEGSAASETPSMARKEIIIERGGRIEKISLSILQ